MSYELAIILVRGIGLGSIFALLAMSFNVVHSSSGILNFAQGNFLVLGGFAAAFLLASPPEMAMWWIMLPIASIIVAALLSFHGWITLLPLRNSTEQDSWMISTMAVSIMIGAGLLITQGPFAQTVQSAFASFRVMGTRTPAPYALCFVAMIVWFLWLKWFHGRTLTGLAISAISQDMEAARAAGLKVRRLQLLAFTISGLVVGSTGFIAAPVLSISADSGFRYVLNGFIAAVVGGMGSNLGAVIAGPLLGIIAMVATYQVGGEYQNFVSLLILVLILMFRPQGLFGRSAARRV